MIKTTTCAAIDLGIRSGRVVVGEYSGSELKLTEIRRFPNTFHTLGKHVYWNIGGIFKEVVDGLKDAKQQFPELRTCGVDAWGVDSVMLDKKGRLVFPVHAYRDRRTEALLKKIITSGRDKALYEWTGIPTIKYNTALQLAESVTSYPHLKGAVDRVLMIPDYFNYLLTGSLAHGLSIASTSQLLDINRLDFSTEALEFFDLPESWFGKPTLAGRKLGKVKDVPGLDNVEVILAPGHDTSCAFEAIPQSKSSLLVSAGSWFLIGYLSGKPATGEIAYREGISNERTGQGTFRPNKLQLGLWLLEKLVADFEKHPENSDEWSALIESAAQEPAPGLLIDTSDQALFSSGNMRESIDNNLKRQHTKPPTTLSGYTRLICDSLARSIADTAQHFSQISGTPFESVSVLAGGSRNRLLCQRIADFTGLPVQSYPLDATITGNLGYQLIGLGVVKDLNTFGKTVANSSSIKRYEPQN